MSVEFNNLCARTLLYSVCWFDCKNPCLINTVHVGMHSDDWIVPVKPLIERDSFFTALLMSQENDRSSFYLHL